MSEFTKAGAVVPVDMETTSKLVEELRRAEHRINLLISSEAAFPSHGTMGEVVQEGMTLRDYFAAKAMATAATFYDTSEDVLLEAARFSYAMADAMIAARNEV